MPRSPVVTVMGHVDHGKTSLLDAIRKARVAAGEAGGITQHVAAYKVAAPGTATSCSSTRRATRRSPRCALAARRRPTSSCSSSPRTTASMPQTVEALSHAKDAKVAIIVAVNKIDMPERQPERVKQQLADHGLIPEEWGGETIVRQRLGQDQGENIDKLLETIALPAEVLELKANPNKPAAGLVIEARLDRNRGPMATVLVAGRHAARR